MTSPFGRVVEDCRRLIQELNTVKCYLLRDVLIWWLMTAHKLARLSYSFPDQFFDRRSIPIEAKRVLLVDAS